MKLRNTYYWVTKDSSGQETQFYEINTRTADHILRENKENSTCSTNPYFKGKKIQELIKNPLIIDSKRVHLRAFLFIASTNPLIVYSNPGFVTYFPFLTTEEVHISHFIIIRNNPLRKTINHLKVLS